MIFHDRWSCECEISCHVEFAGTKSLRNIPTPFGNYNSARNSLGRSEFSCWILISTLLSISSNWTCWIYAFILVDAPSHTMHSCDIVRWFMYIFCITACPLGAVHVCYRHLRRTEATMCTTHTLLMIVLWFLEENRNSIWNVLLSARYYLVSMFTV